MMPNQKLLRQAECGISALLYIIQGKWKSECFNSIFVTTGPSSGGVDDLKILDMLNRVFTRSAMEFVKKIYQTRLEFKLALSSGNMAVWLSNAVLAPPICLRVSLSPIVKAPVSEEVVHVSESESKLHQLKGLLSDASLASSARRLACLTQRKIRSISGSNNKSGSECDLSIHITILE
ncbi:hypothetical protein PIB30_067711 [Stylosanthes scabra]|uniref:Uncharacterized protein n=1 Tax=Stylosanthes scabra TaxID=79078 RepID=A0ABU6RN33_9FABA|nr:hypothetical protein [Stylosanthes scabra]